MFTVVNNANNQKDMDGIKSYEKNSSPLVETELDVFPLFAMSKTNDTIR